MYLESLSRRSEQALDLLALLFTGMFSLLSKQAGIRAEGRDDQHTLRFEYDSEDIGQPPLSYLSELKIFHLGTRMVAVPFPLCPRS